METRFKKFMIKRRARSATAPDNDLIRKSASYEASPPTTRAPIFLYQPLAKSTLEVRRDCEQDAAIMRSFSYNSVTCGKAPVFIQSLPQKGNGPVKLVANRRLSSGELVPATDESQETLRELRDGSYEVARKPRSMSISQGRSETNKDELLTSPVRRSSHSPLPTPTSHTSTSSHTWPNLPRLEIDSHFSCWGSLDTAAQDTSLGLSPSTSANADQARPSQESAIDHRPFSRESASNEGLNLYPISTHNGNATLQALRRAEYSRLVELYGADAAARNLARLNREHYQAAASPVALTKPLYSSIIFEPLPAPPAESRHVESRCASRLSGTSSERSSTSSQGRNSYVSSYAGSSTATAQTSLVEEDSATTREDIRNMIAQMRSTYLDALEQNSPPAAKSKPQRKKQRKPKSIPPSVLKPSDQHWARALPSPGLQTGHPENVNQQRLYTRRINSQPLKATGRLSPIQASPRKNDDNDAGIKRADSTTLGGVMADAARSSIEAGQKTRRRSARKQASLVPRAATIRPVTLQRPLQAKKKASWLNVESDSAEDVFVESPYDLPRARQHPRIVSHHSIEKSDSDHTEHQSSDNFEAIYEDLFGKDPNDFWSSSPSVGRMPSLRLPLLDAAHDDTYQLSTPPKLQVRSMSESPEYTRLARSDQMGPSFI